MAVDTLVKGPERILGLSDVEDILQRMANYERERGCQAVVLLMQNRQLGGSYRIRSIAEARTAISDPRTCEWGIEYFDRSYFERLKEKYKVN